MRPRPSSAYTERHRWHRLVDVTCGLFVCQNCSRFRRRSARTSRRLGYHCSQQPLAYGEDELTVPTDSAVCLTTFLLVKRGVGWAWLNGDGFLLDERRFFGTNRKLIMRLPMVINTKLLLAPFPSYGWLLVKFSLATGQHRNTDIRSAPTLCTFKNRLKTHLFSQSYFVLWVSST